MPKQNIDELTDFGERLTTLHKTVGYTQTELANIKKYQLLQVIDTFLKAAQISEFATDQ